MKLKYLFIGAFAVLTLAPAFTACSSDDEPTAQTEKPSASIPDEIVGDWDFDGFQLNLQKEEGSIYFDNGSNLSVLAQTATYKTFTYSYTASKKELVCTSDDGTSFTLSNVHLDSNGNLQVTHSLTGTEKTETAAKHVADVYSIPDEYVGSWDFADFRLTLEKKSNGILELSDGGNLARSTEANSNVVFTYTYNESKHTLTCKSIDYLHTYTIANVHLDSDGKLSITHNILGTARTESGAKHTYAAVSKSDLLGSWMVRGEELLYFDNDKAQVYEQEEGAWRVEGSSAFITIEGKEIEFVKNIEVNGNTMKAHVYAWNVWKPFTLTRKASDSQTGDINISKLYKKTWVFQQLGMKMSLTFQENGQGTCITVDEDGTETSTFAWTYNAQTHVMTITDDEDLHGTMTINRLTDDEMNVLMEIREDGDVSSMEMNFYAE